MTNFEALARDGTFRKMYVNKVFSAPCGICSIREFCMGFRAKSNRVGHRSSCQQVCESWLDSAALDSEAEEEEEEGA